MQTVIPMTIKMLLDAQYTGDKLEMDGVLITNVVLVGRVTKYQVEPNRIYITITDCTGQITI